MPLVWGRNRVMRLVKFVFWVATTVILAYFMTDFKVGGSTIKDRIDVVLRSDKGILAKEKARVLIDRVLGGSIAKDHLSKPLPQPPEEIKPEDRNQLEDLLKNHQ